MSEAIPAYPFDSTGASQVNKITETQSLYSREWNDFHTLIPNYAPFFATSLIIKNKTDNTILVEGQDYLVTHIFSDATRATAKPVYGSVTFLDNRLAGDFELTYQTLGGEWLIKETDKIRILSNVLVNPRITTWEQVVDLPDRFPVIDHEWNLIDMVGMTDVRNSLEEMADVIENRPNISAMLTAHMSDRDNPHGLTKKSFDLDLVPNYPLADDEDAIIASKDAALMSPRLTKLSIDRWASHAISDEYYNKEEVDNLILDLRLELLNLINN